jgi:hypothetical protein
MVKLKKKDFVVGWMQKILCASIQSEFIISKHTEVHVTKE